MKTVKFRNTTLALALTSLITAAVGAQELNSNIVTNPGAELGDSAFSFDTKESFLGWSQSGSMTPLQYASGGYTDLNTDDSDDISGGVSFIAGGPSAADSEATQEIDLTAFEDLIESGAIGFELSADIGGHSDDSDNATVKVEFLNSSLTPLRIAGLETVTPEDRGYVSKLMPKSTGGNVPPGVTTARVTVQSTYKEGEYNDGYVDNISLVLYEAVCPDDNNKERPGVCGCGVPDVDLNGNNIADCLDPTSTEAPPAPTVVKESRKRLAITMLDYLDPSVIYTLTYNCDLRSERIRTKDNVVTIGRLGKAKSCKIYYTARIKGLEESPRSPTVTVRLQRSKTLAQALSELDVDSCNKLIGRKLKKAKKRKKLKLKKQYCKREIL